MPSLDLSRWQEKPRGVAYRRATIIRTGLQLLLRTRFFKIIVIVAWTAGFGIAVLGFVFNQAISSGGWLQLAARHMGADTEAVVMALGGLLLLFPDIVVSGLFTVIFWLHSFAGLWLTLLALTMVVPQLIARDRATQALTIYLSRPLTSLDYLLGKLGLVVSTVLLVWTGPLLVGWLVSLLFATDRDFVVHSFGPLGRALLFNGIALVALSFLAVGVSAVGRTSRVTLITWAALWLVCGTLANIVGAPAWLQRCSFTQNLSEIRQEVLRLDAAFLAASEQLPLLSREVADDMAKAAAKAGATDAGNALAALALFVALSGVVFLRRIRSET